jgi:uncharacterized protein (DUF362 family)
LARHEQMISRRVFLKGALAVPVGLASAGFPLVTRGQEARPRVVEVQGELQEALKLLLDSLGGIGRFVKSGATVLIKPNMSFPNPPSMATSTSPGLVAAVARHCLEAGAKTVLVADHTMRPPELCLEWTGIRKACAGLKGVEFLGGDQEGMYTEVALPGTRFLQKVKILRVVLKADVHLNLPQMKSHSATTVSLGTKGNMGLIWDRASFHRRLDLNEAIADLNTLARAHLTILDGSRVLTAGGPQGPGTVEALNCLIGGTDPLAVDACGVMRTSWYGRSFRPDEIAHLAACRMRGIGEIDPERIERVALTTQTPAP